MSHSQSKGSSQFRKAARSGSGAAYQQRAGGLSPAVKGGGGGGPGPSASTPLPHQSSPTLSQPAEASISNAASRGNIKRSNGAAGQSRGSSATEFVEHSNQVHSNPSSQQQLQPQLQTQSGVEVAKLQPPPRVPASNGSISRPLKPGVSSSTNTPAVSGEPARASVHPAVSFQFGSISPGFMHNSRMQMPFRTSSAPPNLDEQIRDQVRFGVVTVEQLNAQNISSSQLQQHQHQQGVANHVIEKLVQTSQISSAATTLPPPPHFQQQPITVTPAMPPVQLSQGHGYSIPLQYLQPNSHIQSQIAIPPPQAHLQIQAFAAAQAQHQALAQQSIAPPALPPQQGIIQQSPAQSMKFQPSMLTTPHASQMVASSLSHVPSHLQPQQIPTQINHQLGSHLAPVLGPQLQAVPYLPSSSNQQIFIQPRTNKAVKIVHPDTHEELKFDTRTKKIDGILENSLSNSSGLSGGGSNIISQVRPPANYASGAHPSVNPGGFYTGHSGGGSYPHTSQPYYSNTGLLKPPAGSGATSVKYSFSQLHIAQSALFQSNALTSVTAPSSKMGHSNAVCLEVSNKSPETLTHAVEGPVLAKEASSSQNGLRISNLTSSAVQGMSAVRRQGTTSILIENASAMQTANSGSMSRKGTASLLTETVSAIKMATSQSVNHSEIQSAEKDGRALNVSTELPKQQGSVLPSIQKSPVTTEVPLQFGDVEAAKSISCENAVHADHHIQMKSSLSRSNSDVSGPVPLSDANNSTADLKAPDCSSIKQASQRNNPLDRVSLDLNGEVSMESLTRGMSQGPIDEAADVLQERVLQCAESKNEKDDKLVTALDLEVSKSADIIMPSPDDAKLVSRRLNQYESVYVDATLPLKELPFDDVVTEVSKKVQGEEVDEKLLGSDLKNMTPSSSCDIQIVSSTDSLEVNEEKEKHDGVYSMTGENLESNAVKGSDIYSSMLDSDKVKSSEAQKELSTTQATVETDVKSFDQDDKHQGIDSSKLSDGGSEEGRTMEQHQPPMGTVTKSSCLYNSRYIDSLYNGRNTDVSLQQQRQQQHDDASFVSLKATSSQQSSSSANAAPEVKRCSKKKQKKETLARADAAGNSADLYNAYKAPEKIEDEVKKVDVKGGPSVVIEAKESTEVTVEGPAVVVGSSSVKEVDDWEDGAEVPSPKVQAGHVDASVSVNSESISSSTSESQTDRKYTRDFLLTFRKQNRDLPSDFEIRADVAELLLSLGDRDLLQSSGRVLDRQLSGGPRLERRGSSAGNSDEERWNRQPGFISADNRLDMGVPGFRQGFGMNSGLIARAPAGLNQGVPLSNFGSGLISGAGSVRGADNERWQRVAPVQKGLIPSPQTSVPPIHKAEKKYEVGRPSDDEVGKQRQIKGILNKLTPQNLERLFDKVKEVNIETAHALTGVISQIFDKALMEPFFCEMYATFCVKLAAALPEFNENGVKITFRRVLLNKCQEEFERGEREQAEADRPEEEGEVKLSSEEKDEKRLKARRRMLGNIRFIGELYKKGMITERIMHECILTLLGDYQIPDEEDVEALCKLMSTIGQMIDRSKAKDHMDAYFGRMLKLSDNQKLPSRLRFMLKDVIDLRRNGWKERRKVEGPKKIEEVHRDAAQERQTVAGRFSRGSNMGTSSGRRATHVEEPSTRGGSIPLFSPPSAITGISRGLQQPQLNIRAGHGQDVRVEERLLMDSRPFPMPLSQRSADDPPITLGPQGGLGRGMSVRAQPLPSGRSTLAEASSAIVPDRCSASNNKDDISQKVLGSDIPPSHLDRPLLEKPNFSDRHVSGASGIQSLERTLSERPVYAVPSKSSQYDAAPTSATSNVTSAVLSEEQLQKKTQSTIDKFYSVRDYKEVSLCVEDLKSPNFHASMVSLWILHSFEKKDIERELLTNLLIYLYQNEPFLLKQDHISKGFEIVLSVSEDTFIDVPRAPEYLAVMFGKLVVAGIIPLIEVGKLLKDGGLEPESLVQNGDGIKILVGILETMKKEKGESGMLELYRLSALRLEDFILSEDIQRGRLNDLLEQKKLQCLCPMMSIEQHLRAMLEKDEPPSEILKWLERHAHNAQSEPSFPRMVMGQFLRHSVPAATGNCEKDEIKNIIQRKMRKYSPILRRFASATPKAREAIQRQYIVAVQLFMNDLGYPSGLMTTLFSVLYEEEVISESAFYKWQDDINDPTPGRDKAIRAVGKWLQWLATAPEETGDE